MRVLVTGAQGFIGGAIARRLVADAGMSVLAASRSQHPAQAGLVPVRLDVRDPASLAAAMQGVEAVIHCAVGDRATTTEGTRNVLDAARAAGVRRLVHLSSISVYGMAEGLVTEASPRVSAAGDGYAAWKSAAEAICESARGIDIVMLRPTIVHGAGSDLWVTKMACRLRAGAIGQMGAMGEGLCNLVHVSDVAQAALAGLYGRPGAYNINGPEAIAWNVYFARLAAAIGVACPVLRPAVVRFAAMAAWPFKAVARALPARAQALPVRLLQAPGWNELPLFGLHATYPTDAAARGLDWAPVVGVAEGLADGAAWLRAA